MSRLQGENDGAAVEAALSLSLGLEDRETPLDAAACLRAALELSRAQRVDRPGRAYLEVCVSALRRGAAGELAPSLTRAALWLGLRRAKRNVSERSLRVLCRAWNAAQAGRPEWTLRNRGRDELLRVFGDYYPDRRRPHASPSRRGIHVPVARIRRMAGLPGEL